MVTQAQLNVVIRKIAQRKKEVKKLEEERKKAAQNIMKAKKVQEELRKRIKRMRRR